MLVSDVPFLEPVQRVVVFKDKEKSDGQDLLVGMREAMLQVIHEADIFSEASQEIGSTVIQAFRFGERLGAWFCWGKWRGCRFLLLRPSSCGDNLAGGRVNFTDAGACGSGLLLRLVPVIFALIGICDASSFVGLGNDCHRPHLVMFYLDYYKT